MKYVLTFSSCNLTYLSLTISFFFFSLSILTNNHHFLLQFFPSSSPLSLHPPSYLFFLLFLHHLLPPGSPHSSTTQYTKENLQSYLKHLLGQWQEQLQPNISSHFRHTLVFHFGPDIACVVVGEA